jgi:hypothetical protein
MLFEHENAVIYSRCDWRGDRARVRARGSDGLTRWALVDQPEAQALRSRA